MGIVNMLCSSIECFKEHFKNEILTLKQNTQTEETIEIKKLKQENNKLKEELKIKQQIITKLIGTSQDHHTSNIKTPKKHPSSSQKHNTIKTTKKTQHTKNKKKYIEVVGDSMLNNIDEIRLNSNRSRKYNIKIRNHPGATSIDILDHLKPVIRKKPDVIIIHAGTNDITADINYLKNVKVAVKMIKTESPETKICFSSIIRRFDIKRGKEKVDEINKKLKNYCQQQEIDIIYNENITEDLLGRKKLHPNIRGKSVLVKNLISYLD